MIKAIVVAENYSQYAAYMRNRRFKREEYEYFKHDCPDCIRGLNKNIPVHWLEGWRNNWRITPEDIQELTKRFTEHIQVPERRIYNEGIVF